MGALISILPILAMGLGTADRVYRRLDSGAALVVESRGGEIASVQLFASSRACSESPSNHGQRHLLEHLLAKGKDGKLGERLESEGWFISAETYRDFMAFKLAGPASRWERAAQAVSEILGGWPHTQESISNEALIIEQEIAILPKETRISGEAWQGAYGALGLDPIGSYSSISSATPESLAAIHMRQFARNQLTVSVCGPVDSKAVIERFTAVLGGAPKPIEAKWPRNSVGTSGVAKVPGCAAAYIAVGPYSTSETAAVVGVACLVGIELDRGFITYTPSQSPGLVIVGTSSSDDLGVLRAAFSKITPDLSQVREIAARWAGANSQSTVASAWWNGIFQVQAPGGKPDLYISAVENMTQEDLDSAMNKLRAALEVGSR